MKIFLVIWALPVALFWGWYGLSYHNMHFGSVYLSRKLHDMVFAMLGDLTGADPVELPGIIANACAADGVMIVALLVWQRRRTIWEWLNFDRRDRAQA